MAFFEWIFFPDYHQIERAFFARTGIFPAMHALVIKEELYRQNRWLATSIYKACEEAKRISLAQTKFTGALRFMLPWLPEALEEIDQVFGGDPWRYGIRDNVKTLDAFNQALVSDRFLSAPLSLDEVFVPIEGLSA